MDVIAEGLAFPEGPVVMEDGSVIVVETNGQRVTRCWNGRKEVVCETGGGPNGLAIGPDGALWLCNNGGLGVTGPGTEGRIERIDLGTGKLERVYDSCDGIMLEAPNDLAFDSSGRLWFTDFGTILENGKAYGGFYCCQPDGSSITAIKRGALSYNGTGTSPDERYLYVADTFSSRLYRFDARAEAQEPQWIATAMGDVAFDSLAMAASGNVCVAVVLGDAIATISPTGDIRMTAMPANSLPTNIAFGGADMRDAYITLSAPGHLVRMRWDEPGLKMPFTA